MDSALFILGALIGLALVTGLNHLYRTRQEAADARLQDEQAAAGRLRERAHRAEQEVESYRRTLDDVFTKQEKAEAARLEAARQPVGEVVVYTRQPDDRTLRGALLSNDADGLQLGRVRYAQEQASGTALWIDLEGTTRLPWSSISFWQELPPGAE